MLLIPSVFYYPHLVVKEQLDINCLIHGQTTAVAAVSSIKESFMSLIRNSSFDEHVFNINQVLIDDNQEIK